MTKKSSVFSSVSLIAVIMVLASCRDTLNDFKKELSKGGFALWYPAEAGITAGQIWRIRDEQKDILFSRPAGLQVTGPSPTKFESLKKEVSADISLDASFADQFLSKVGPLSAELKHSTVKSISIEFGATEIERLPLGQLQNSTTVAGLPQEYHDALGKVRAGQQEYVFIAAVVTASGMKYTFECEDTESLRANAPKIAELIGANFEIKIVSEAKAIWEIPSSQRMTIGVSPIVGEMLEMSNEEIAATLQPLLTNKQIKPAQFFPRLREVPKKVRAKSK